MSLAKTVTVVILLVSTRVALLDRSIKLSKKFMRKEYQQHSYRCASCPTPIDQGIMCLKCRNHFHTLPAYHCPECGCHWLHTPHAERCILKMFQRELGDGEHDGNGKYGFYTTREVMGDEWVIAHNELGIAEPHD